MPLIKPSNLTYREWMIQRFWKGVNKRSDNECWPWLKAKVTDGYGTISLIKGVPYATHRLAYEIAYGPIPEGLWVLHSCDNPACCNPLHLSVGSSLDNVQDMLNKRRGGKLTKEQVESIRADVRKQDRIAVEFGITQSMVSRIKKGSRWNNKVYPPEK